MGVLPLPLALSAYDPLNDCFTGRASHRDRLCIHRAGTQRLRRGIALSSGGCQGVWAPESVLTGAVTKCRKNLHFCTNVQVCLLYALNPTPQDEPATSSYSGRQEHLSAAGGFTGPFAAWPSL